MEKMKNIFQEIVFIIAPVAISLFVFRLLKNFPLSPYVTILGSLVSLLLVAALFLKMDWKWLVLIRSAGIGLLYLFWLKETPFSFEGMFGDNRYYTLAMEKFYYSFLPWSHEYKNIHFSLPPLFFFLIGRIGALLKVPLLDVLKYSSYLFVVYLPYLWGYFLGGIFKKDKWLAAFILSLLIACTSPLPEYSSLAYLAQKGFHFLGMFLILVWYLWLKREKPHFLKAGIAAGAIFALNFSPFIFIFMAIVFDLLGHLFADCQANTGLPKACANLFRELFYYLRLGVVALLVNLVWLLPVILDLLTHRLGISFNNYFSYNEGYASIFQSLALLDPFNLFSIVLIIGLCNLFLNVSRQQEIDHLRLIFFGLIMFALIFYSLSFAKITIPLHHFSLFILHVAALAAVFFAMKFKSHVLLPLAFSLLVIFSIFQLNDNKQNRYALDRAKVSSAIYQRGSQLRQTYDFYEQTIFPSTNELFFGKKTYSFITADFFSDAAASFDDRLEYVRGLYRFKEAGQTAAFFKAMKNTPFGELDYILLQKGKDGGLFFSINAYHNDLMEFPARRKFFYFAPADFPQAYVREIYRDDAFVVYKLN